MNHAIKVAYYLLGTVPNNIKISTIHSFLYQELIAPFYYFLYRKHFEQLSVIELPNDQVFKRTKLSELENGNVLHYTLIPEKAKWVAYQKSGDTKAIKELRKKLLNHFAEYCAAIFVDEAQDINKDIKHILEALNQAGINVFLYGDPKQDVRLPCKRNRTIREFQRSDGKSPKAGIGNLYPERK